MLVWKTVALRLVKPHPDLRAIAPASFGQRTDDTPIRDRSSPLSCRPSPFEGGFRRLFTHGELSHVALRGAEANRAWRFASCHFAARF